MATPATPVNVRQKVMVLDNSAIVALAKIPEVAREFPFLASLGRYAVKLPGCITCSASSADKSFIEAAKSTMAYMPDTQKTRLKVIVNVDAIQIHLSTPQGAKKVQF